MDAENANTIPDEFNDIDLFQYEPPEQFDISENFENAPKVVTHDIPISFIFVTLFVNVYCKFDWFSLRSL